MSDPILPLLVCVACLLLILSGAEAWFGARIRHGVGLAATSLAGWGCLLTLVWLALGNGPDSLRLPVGPPGLSLGFALDALTAFGLVLVFVAGAACIGFATELRTARRQTPIAGPTAALGACVLALLAADPVALSVSLAAVGLALGLSAPRAMGSRRAGVVLLGTFSLTAGFLAVMRAAGDPAVSGGGTWVLPLTLGGLIALALPRGRRTGAGSEVGDAIVAGCLSPTIGVIILRLLLTPALDDRTAWYAVPVLLLGAAIAVRDAWCATRADDVGGVAARLIRQLGGWTLTALGLVLMARASDLPAMAALALGAVSLLLTGLALGGTLVALAIWAAHWAAGSPRLDRLGGLLHRMPASGSALLIGFWSLLALPPGLGFAGLWLLAHAVLAAPRTGVLPAWGIALTLAALALAAALSLAAMLRLVGVAYLGRPRAPRGSAAEEVPGPARAVLFALTGLTVLVALLPGLIPGRVAGPALRLLNGGTAPELVSVLGLGAGRTGYVPLGLAVLVAVVAVPACWFRGPSGSDDHATRPWTGGFAPPPPWLPYGDPLTQLSPDTFIRSPSIARWLPVGMGEWIMRRPADAAARPRTRSPTARPAPVILPWLVAGAFLPLLVWLLAHGRS